MTAITAAEFAGAMARLSPFEKNPVVAIGVSGGADSMALLHLAHEWAQGQGGHVVALTIDHNIRATSADEAIQVAAWAAVLGVELIIIKWDDADALASALQSRARVARHKLLSEATAARGILHLAIAHHQDDQAETVLLRLSKGSGPDGLACMSSISHKSQIRLLRPLLDFPSERLAATCRERGQDWIEDPSNQLLRFARPRLRAVSGALATEGLTAHHLALTAAACGRTRSALEQLTANYLGQNGRVLPQGYAELTLTGADNEIMRRALAQLVQTIGGGDYQANAGAADQVLSKLSSSAKAEDPSFYHSLFEGHVSPALAGDDGLLVRTTLGGCLIDSSKNKLLIMRENRHMEPSQTLQPGQDGRWGRFAVWAADACIVGALGGDLPVDAETSLPKIILALQPAFRIEGQVQAVPTIGYYAHPTLINHCKAWFSPKSAAGNADFAIV